MDCQEATNEEEDDLQGKRFIAEISIVFRTFSAELDHWQSQVGGQGE